MTRRRAIAVVLVAALAVAAAGGCARRAVREDGIAVAGDTRVDLVTVAAPRLTTPTIDVTVGIVRSLAARGAGGAAKGRTPAGGAGPRRITPAGLLATVTVRPGDVVKKGQVLAVFDDRLLRLGVQNAEAAGRRNASGGQALAQQASDLRDQRATLREQRAKLAAGLGQLEKGIAGVKQLESAVAQLRAGIAQTTSALAKLNAARAQLAKKLAEAEAAAASSSPPPGIDQVIAQLKAKIAQLDGQIAALTSTRAGLRQQLAKLEATLAAVKAKLPANPGATVGQLQSGRQKIGSALSQLGSGIDQLESASSKIESAQGVQSVAVEAARAALGQGTLRAPRDGVVVSAMQAGEVAMVGAPVVVIRPAGDTLVDTYLTPEQLQRVKVGVPAEVSMDSVPRTLKGRVSAVSAEEQFPPSNYPTQIVHLSRVVRVTVSVPETLPLGVPADVVIRPSS